MSPLMRQCDSKNAMGIVQCAYIICNRILNKMPITISTRYLSLPSTLLPLSSLTISSLPLSLLSYYLSHYLSPFNLPPSLLSYYLSPFNLPPSLLSYYLSPFNLPSFLLSYYLSPLYYIVFLYFHPSPSLLSYYLSPLLLSLPFIPPPFYSLTIYLLSYYLSPFIPLNLSSLTIFFPLYNNSQLHTITFAFFLFILEMITRHQDLLGDYGVA